MDGKAKTVRFPYRIAALITFDELHDTYGELLDYYFDLSVRHRSIL
ncbi:MAG: hypothetical protein ACLTJG_07025 [[Clostridium] innocuum]